MSHDDADAQLVETIRAAHRIFAVQRSAAARVIKCLPPLAMTTVASVFVACAMENRFLGAIVGILGFIFLAAQFGSLGLGTARNRARVILNGVDSVPLRHLVTIGAFDLLELPSLAPLDSLAWVHKALAGLPAGQTPHERAVSLLAAVMDEAPVDEQPAAAMPVSRLVAAFGDSFTELKK